MVRLFKLVFSKIDRHTIGLITLLFIVLISMVSGIAAVVRGLETSFLWPIAFWGMLLGWFLARSRISGRVATFVGVLLGISMVLLRVGDLGKPLLDLSVDALGVLIKWIDPNVSPDLLSFQFHLSVISTTVSGVIERIYIWILNFTQGTPLYDSVALSVIWGSVSWLTSIWAGWSLRRYAQPIWAIAPATVVLEVALTYISGRGLLIVPVLGATLMLIGIVKYDIREREWEESGLDYAAVIREDMTWVILGLSLAAMLLAALIPSFSVGAVFNPVRDLFSQPVEEQEDIVRSFGLDPQGGFREKQLGTSAGLGGLPRSQLIGSGPELSERVVMVVQILSGWNGQDIDPYLPIYFRSRSFDQYTGLGWSTSDTSSRAYQPGEDIRSRSKAYHRTLLQDFQLTREGGGLLYVAGNLISADKEFSVYRRVSHRDETSIEQHLDVFGAVVDSSSYQTLSLVPVVSEESLRSAQAEYPLWVQARYLSLPEPPSQRILDLANDLTRTQSTTYDKLRSIESYLRTYPYTLDLPEPPDDKDIADYFLFELQKGYCDYYSTAMVVLARSVGIPARMVSGYTRGTYEPDSDRFIITEANAHSWVEVYFPSIGWVPFEPTGGRPALERPVQALEVPADLEGSLPSDVLKPKPAWYQWSPRNLIIWIGLSIIVMVGGWIRFDAWRLRNAPPDKAIKKVYVRLYKYGERLAVFHRKTLTPYEFSASLTAEIESLSQGRYIRELLIPTIPLFHDLTEKYVGVAYSPRSSTVEDQIRTVKTWERLRFRLLIGVVWQRFRNLFFGEVHESSTRLHDIGH